MNTQTEDQLLMAPKKPQYQRKVIKFGSTELELWSLDGHTWSSRKDELEEIKNRQEQNRVTFEQIRSGASVKKEASPAKDEEEESEDSDDQKGPSKASKNLPPAKPKKPLAAKADKPKKVEAKKAKPKAKPIAKAKPSKAKVKAKGKKAA